MQAEEIYKKFKELEDLINKFILNEDKKNKVNQIIEYFEDRIITAPASTNRKYHHCYSGGWLEYTIKIIKHSFVLSKYFSKFIDKNYTDEELFISALFSHLSKLGNFNEPYYIKNNDKYKKQKGFKYTTNDKINNKNMGIKTLFLISHFGLELTENEYYTIYNIYNNYNYNQYDKQNILSEIIKQATYISIMDKKE